MYRKGILFGKKALITGGANGIGKAIVKEFLKQGARVTAVDIDKLGIQKCVSEGLKNYYCVDITDKKSVYELFRDRSLGNIDVLVNNAGIDMDFFFGKPDDYVWKSVIETNLYGARYMSELAVKHMKNNGIKGSVIFITSVHTAQAFVGGGAYDASKHALVGLMRVLALEYGHCGIRSNAVAPGIICAAGRNSKLSKNQKDLLSKKVPLKRLGIPEDVALLTAFLASENASYVNGAEIRVDGGLSIKNSLFY